MSRTDTVYSSPEYRRALDQENLVWNAAFVPEVTESIGGVAVLPFTPAMHLRLKLGGSPFVTTARQKITRGDVALFLWQVSPKFQVGRTRRSAVGWRRFWFFRSIRRRDFFKLTEAIWQYIDEAFQDCAPGGVRRKAQFSIAVPYLHRLCPKYGTVQDVLNMPYKQIFQLWNAHRMERGESLSAPSDAVRAELRARSNREQKGAHVS